MTKADSKVTSLKVLIATASVAATVGGWAQLARHNSEVAGAPQQMPQATVQASSPTLRIDALTLPTIPPVPTIVPAPDFSKLALGTGQASSQVDVTVPTIAPLPPTPTSAPPQPTPRPRTRQPLRPATIPQPAPQAVTRSSR